MKQTQSPDKIDYPGSGNKSEFLYDGVGLNTKIIETVANVVTDTRQFVWTGGARWEERNASGSLTKQFYSNGQTISGANYFYTKDQLGSIREMADATANIQAQYCFDSYGRQTVISQAQTSDLRYAGYFSHKSGLSLTTNRAYNSALGRWINRDPIGEYADNNLFAYAFNLPTSVVDPSGLQGNVITAPSSGMGSYVKETFEQMTGAPSGALDMGCIAVVDFYLGLGPGQVPEYFFKKNCWWGKGSDVTPAVENAKKCAANNPCPKGSHRVIWCKQGTWGQGGANPNKPGSPVTSPGNGWNNAGGNNFNYAVYFPQTSTFIGANVGGGLGYASTSMHYGDEFGSSMCCSTCVKNK